MAISKKRPPKYVLARLCKQKKSHKAIGKIFGVAGQTVGWWLQQYGLKTVNGSNPRATRKPHCKVCDTKNPKKFYYGRKTYCKKCWSRRQTTKFKPQRQQRRVTLKYAAVQAKGGCCQKCGYRKNLAALQFHHPDREYKHENWHTLFRQTAHSSKHIKTLAQQLEHCELLCANCHAEHHHPKTEMPICVSGKMLMYLSNWVIELKHLFHCDIANGKS